MSEPMKVFGIFKKEGVFGKEELIPPLYLDETYAFSQMHCRNLDPNFRGYYLLKDLEVDETKNQKVLCAKRKDGVI